MHDSSPTQARQHFGTDGIRGVANREPLTPDTVMRLAHAVGTLLIEDHVREPREQWPNCIIGKDTRISGGMLESAFAAGLSSVGVDVTLVGVIPTPAVAFLTPELGAALGVVISASHNPYPDNGIKFFGADGYKLTDSRELEIEARLAAALTGPLCDPEKAPTGGRIGRLGTLKDAVDRYVHYVLGVVAGNDRNLLQGIKIALDASNGAACRTSPEILRHLGADLELIHAQPNGVNINEDCGCTHPASIQKAVVECGAAVGLAHDGDADRVLLCDEKGDLVDGDEIMAIAATAMIKEGRLASSTLVTTVMSNFGLNDLIESRGGKVLRTDVGDRYVMETMRARDLNFGGEQSGHFIFRDDTTTGDGIVAALRILQIMTAAGRPLSELRTVLEKYPQAQRNLDVSSKPPLEELQAMSIVRETETALGEGGRVLLRYSGTEPKIRLLIEGKDATWIEKEAERIAEAISAQIGT
jgi:phosphoglucosamine mutase